MNRLLPSPDARAGAGQDSPAVPSDAETALIRAPLAAAKHAGVAGSVSVGSAFFADLVHEDGGVSAFSLWDKARLPGAPGGSEALPKDAPRVAAADGAAHTAFSTDARHTAFTDDALHAEGFAPFAPSFQASDDILLHDGVMAALASASGVTPPAKEDDAPAFDHASPFSGEDIPPFLARPVSAPSFPGTPPGSSGGGNGGANNNFRHLELADLLDDQTPAASGELDSLLEAGLTAFMHSGNTGAVGKALGCVLGIAPDAAWPGNAPYPGVADVSPPDRESPEQAGQASLFSHDQSAPETHHLLLLQSGLDVA